MTTSKQKLFQDLAISEPAIVGILNLTPDSFSDAGRINNPQAALSAINNLVKEGANIVELGAESTRPGASVVPLETELERLMPVLKQINFRQQIVSVDTYKAKVAQVAADYGVKIINDVSALRADPDLVKIVAQNDLYIVLMYSKESPNSPHASFKEKDYSDLILEIREFLEERINLALAAGVNANKIILDPGMGRFISHDPKYSWELLRRFSELTKYFKDFPLMICTSRKGFLGGELSERDALSQLTALNAVVKGASLVRTHNVGMMREFVNAWNI